jgi:hypothetical protein
MGGRGADVEADETYFGNKAGEPAKRTIRGKPSLSHKRAILALVERGGQVRSFHVDRADKPTVAGIVRRNVNRETSLHTDESGLYQEVGWDYARHGRVEHAAGEYVRGDVHTNTVEGYFSIFKRGMKGVYQHCAEKHLHRYLAEFDFRYNNRVALGIGDAQRSDKALAGIVGRRLTYRDSSVTG